MTDDPQQPDETHAEPAPEAPAADTEAPTDPGAPTDPEAPTDSEAPFSPGEEGSPFQRERETIETAYWHAPRGPLARVSTWLILIAIFVCLVLMIALMLLPN